MTTPTLVSPEIVAEVFKALERPGGTPAELRRLAHEEPELHAWLDQEIEILLGLLKVWGAPLEALAAFKKACRVHVAGISVAWRLARQKRWEREEPTS